MNALDLTPIVQPILAVIGAVLTALVAIYVPKALAIFEVRTGIQITDQQRETFIGAVQTARGIIESKLDQGALSHAHIDVANLVIRAQAQAAINAVPNAAAALDMTVDNTARMIVARVDLLAHPSPVTTTVVVTEPQHELTPQTAKWIANS